MTQRINNPDTEADIELRRYLDLERPPCFVMVAGAGSGKTTSLIKALDHVGKRYGSKLRAAGKQIACITYTEVATGEVRRDVGNNALYHVSTIHSFLWSLVRTFQKDIRNWVRQRIEERLAEQRQKQATFGSRTQAPTREKVATEIARLRDQLGKIEHVRRFSYESGSDFANGLLGHDDIIRLGSFLIQERRLLCKIVAQRYPFCFVDESQDTFPDVVSALKTVTQEMPGSFCLGFFGDPMQKIYGHGVGDIELHPGQIRITKPENFRCPQKVLSVINRIRSRGDGLEQSRGRVSLVEGKPIVARGNAFLFVLPSDNNRFANVNRVRDWMSKRLVDPLWLDDSGGTEVRILVIVHRMAAAGLGFSSLFAAFTDNTLDSVAASFREGTHWAIRPFTEVLLPIVQAQNRGRHFEVISLLRCHCPRLDSAVLDSKLSIARRLSELRDIVVSLGNLLGEESVATVGDVLAFAREKNLLRLDDRFNTALGEYRISSESHKGTSGDAASGPALTVDQENTWTGEYLRCRANELWGYLRYLRDESPYSTQQGVKGAEFERVVVILDDEESRHFQFSYDKLLGLKELSDTDRRNLGDGKETTLERTRRLFYVCCSRATRDLAVVLFSKTPRSAAEQVRKLALFEDADVVTEDDL